MRFHFYTSIILLLVLLLNGSAKAQFPLSPNAKISVLTCEKGEELYSVFGHTAIRIKDDSRQLDVVYNYGTFDFETSNFYLKFIKGDLQYFVSAYSFQDFYYEYTFENRSIYEQQLLLTVIQKQALFSNLNGVLQSDKKYYTYKFIDRNCTSMVADKINETFGKKVVVNITDTDKSYREILFPYVASHFWENFGISLIFGLKTDAQGQKLFLPNQLMESLKNATFNNTSIATKPVTILQAKPSVITTPFWDSYYVFLGVLLLLLYLRKKLLFLIYFVIMGLLGIFLSTVGLYSSHQEILYNYNVLLFNPSLFFFIYFTIKNKTKALQKTIFFNLVCLVVYLVILIPKIDLWLFLPLIGTSLLIFYWMGFSKTSK